MFYAVSLFSMGLMKCFLQFWNCRRFEYTYIPEDFYYFWWIDIIETKHFHVKRNWSNSLERLFNKTMNSVQHSFIIHTHTQIYLQKLRIRKHTRARIHAYIMPDVSHRPCHHISERLNEWVNRNASKDSYVNRFT